MIALNRRRVMGANVPYDSKVEYLESSGTQWIDTGVIPTSNSGFYLDAVTLSANSTNPTNVGAFGAGNYAWAEALALYAKLNGHAFANTPLILGIRQAFNVKISYDNRFQISLIDNIITASDGTTTQVTSFIPLGMHVYLFGNNFNGTLSGASILKVYNFKMYDRSEIILDLIPVRIGNVGYMYDKVSKQLFGNMGTGNFILGGDV